jgi:hypothetical protein
VSPEFPKGGAIITVDGRKTRHYEQAKRTNAILEAWGPTLMRLTSTSVVRIAPTDDPTWLLAGTPIRALTSGDYLVGVLRHEDGRRAVLLLNWDTAFTSWPTVEFDTPLDQVREVDPATGEESPVVDDSPEMEGLQLSLDSGGARLFLMP